MKGGAFGLESIVPAWGDFIVACVRKTDVIQEGA
jgi:hypothetical protein